jgi:hypothetical protein
MYRLGCLVVGILMGSNFAVAQSQIRDGSGGGEAHYCIERGVSPDPNQGSNSRVCYWPTVALQNTCSRAVSVYFCGLTDIPGDQWGCYQLVLEAGKNTTWSQMDSLKLACIRGTTDECRIDPSCSNWTVVWNAVYKDSGQAPARPDVPKRTAPLSGR